MQFAGQPKPPVGVVFDSDLGNDIGSILALALLYGLDGKNECRVVSLSVSKSNLDAAAFCDAIGRFYAGPVNTGFGGFARTLPVGLSTDGKSPETTPILTTASPKYPHNIHKLNETAEPAALIRNAFTAQHDQNCIVVLAGPATNLVRTLALPGAKDLIASKVRYLAFGATEAAVRGDEAAAAKLLNDWPTPIFVSDPSTGSTVPYPGASIDRDYSWTQEHPVADAYRAFRAMPYDADTTAMAAVLYALRPKEGYFQTSEPGSVAIGDDGKLRFNPKTGGRVRVLSVDAAQKDRITKAYTELASAKPVPKQRPQRPPKVDEAPAKPEKPLK